MCGIFGVLIRSNSTFSKAFVRDTVTNAFRLSESRGKEASGIVARIGPEIFVLKEPVAASRLIQSDEYSRIFNQVNGTSPLAILGHSRLVTNGRSEMNSNNQPVIKDGAVGIHNGIIVNDDLIWKKYPHLSRQYNVDTEVFLSLLQNYRKNGTSLVESARKTYADIDGSASIAVLFNDLDSLVLASNTGSLYSAVSKARDMFVFASEKHILHEWFKRRPLTGFFEKKDIFQIKAGTGTIVSLSSLDFHAFSLNGQVTPDDTVQSTRERVRVIELSPAFETSIPDPAKYRITDNVRTEMVQSWERIFSSGVSLKRCTRCVLPETMPYISFDDEGVCNYCRNFEKRGGTQLKGEKALEDLVAPYRSTTGEPDCIVGFSGGRDSTYGLDYIVNTLKMHPIVFTYDWAMVNDLARRNQARVISRLGIEQVIVSADIRKKREYIRKNLLAWLDKPELGMVPILMAGDKEFYYYFHEIRKQTGVKIFFFCGGHEIEETPFKYGFCGVDHGVMNVMNCLTGISRIHKFKMMWYFARQYLKNPGYINNSLFDTLFAYYSTYLLPDDYIYLYHFIEWDEKEIISTIRDKYDWELAPDTNATWRTDDGTAAFYNYIYLTMAGFTEFDNFRSYQIREGKITRDEAMEMIREENRPRFEAIEWYAEAIDVDVNMAIRTINEAKTILPPKSSLRGSADKQDLPADNNRD